MNTNKSFFERNGGTYRQVGDYLLPNLTINTVLKLKALFRYRAQSLGIAAFSSEYKVLFDTFSFKK